MMNDLHNLSTSQMQTSKKSKPKIKRGDGFFESIGEIGRSIGSSIKNDVLKGVTKNAHDQLIQAGQSKQLPDKQPNFDFSEWLRLKEDEIAQENIIKGRKQERTFSHINKPEQVVFSLQDEKLKREINEVRQELQLLIQTIGKVEQQIETAIIQEVVDPGVYHLNFFQKMAVWLRTLRKSLEEGELWMEMWKSRSKRSAYWRGVKKSGTSFMLSGERNIATQTG